LLDELLAHLRNYFLLPGGIHPGTYTISGGGITLPFLAAGQYFRIVGSVFNDGVYAYPVTGLTPETFEGAVWALAVPAAVVSLAEEIAAWQGKHGETIVSPLASESFGGYSYAKSTGGAAAGAITCWQDAFRGRMNQWRKL
jgi:hypothetical protein